jgi:exopolysaccharide production protein ExoQ
VPPTVALLLWLVLLLGLLLFDPAKDPETSLALWVPLIWVFIIASRLPSQWLGGEVGSAIEAFEEGNSLDRVIYLILIVLAIGILTSRRLDWAKFFSSNLALVIFVFFALVSVLWSDAPFVAFKRWARDLGSYLVILVVLSDRRPLEAVRTLLRRLSYLLIPLSILLIKYYPSLGIQYSVWTGGAMYMGPTTGKNTLGVVCLISALFFFWDTVTRWSNRKDPRTKRIILVNVGFLAASVWLLRLTDSATSRVCFVLGCLVIVVVHSHWGKRHRTFIKVMIPSSFLLYVILTFAFNINAVLAGHLGRDPTLTDRTNVWHILLSLHTNPAVGTGYESFWLGPRLQWLWQQGPTVGLNEAHNGYLEVYLNLGAIGVLLLVAVILKGYRNINKKLALASQLAPLSLALWIIALFYNMTEAAFKWHLMWIAFLLAIISLPEQVEDQVQVPASSSKLIRTESSRKVRNYR